MTVSIKTSPPNSVVLIMDANGGVIPQTMQHALIANTDSCIAVGCKSADDGESEFIFGSIQDMNIEGVAAFEGHLCTPSRIAVIKTVLGEKLAETSVQKAETFIRIWVNDVNEPDRIIIGVE